MAPESLVHMERRLVKIITEHVWNNLKSVEHVPWGYETHTSQKVRSLLTRFSVENNPTARHIRHAPDAFIVQQNPHVLYLVDYKCTARPVYSDWIIKKVSRKASRNVEWEDIGVIHTTSYDNYAKLQKKLGVKVAILTYIAYHHRLLLCDFIENIKELRRDRVRETKIGSGKDLINFDASQLRTLEEFLVDAHGRTVANIAPQIQRARNELYRFFPVNHHPNSPYKNSKPRKLPQVTL